MPVPQSLWTRRSVFFGLFEKSLNVFGVAKKLRIGPFHSTSSTLLQGCESGRDNTQAVVLSQQGSLELSRGRATSQPRYPSGFWPLGVFFESESAKDFGRVCQSALAHVHLPVQPCRSF